MTTDANKASFRVVLRKRVIVNDALVFDAEREVDLPMAPCVGLRLYNSEWRPEGCDDSDDPIEEIAYDLKTGSLICYLPIDDFRPEASGSDEWTEEDVREHYQDWALESDEIVQGFVVES